MKAPDELNERQQALVAQVREGGVQEEEPDTEEQLLRLAELGHLNASHETGEWLFTVADDDEPEPEPEPDQQGE